MFFYSSNCEKGSQVLINLVDYAETTTGHDGIVFLMNKITFRQEGRSEEKFKKNARSHHFQNSGQSPRLQSSLSQSGIGS